MKRALICFTRVPTAEEPRFSPTLSPHENVLLHRAFLKDLGQIAASVEADLFLAYAPGAGEKALRSLFPSAKAFFPQEGEELGARMEHALTRVLAQGYGACVLFGGDVPLMTADHLLSAFQALETADVTLGPAEDGAIIWWG